MKEYGGDENNRDLVVIDKVSARENIACISPIETQYYSNNRGKMLCIFCGKGGKSLTITEEAYPKCQKCSAKKDILKRKRKTVTSNDLLSKKKKNN